MDVGNKIKALRQQRGLTLEEVGQYVGVGKSTVRKWETGQIANMRRDKIPKLAEVLGTTPSEIIGLYDNADPPPEKGLVLSKDEKFLVTSYRGMNDQGKEYVLQTVTMASQIYKKPDALPDLEDPAS